MTVTHSPAGSFTWRWGACGANLSFPESAFMLLELGQ
jgi:hypothetical protein